MTYQYAPGWTIQAHDTRPAPVKVPLKVEDPSSTYAPKKRDRLAAFPQAVGAVVFTWDDGFGNWAEIATEAANRGQRHTFCVTSDYIGNTGIADYITTVDVQAIASLGHEIAAHSKTHTSHPGMTPAARVAEYDTPKSVLEGIIGAGKVTTYVYPFGSSNGGRDITCDREVWGRYNRVLDTNGTGVTPSDDRYGTFLVPRRSWTSGNHAEAMSLIRLAATQPVVVCLFSHHPDYLVGGSPDITWTQMLEAFDLAQSLGIPCVTAAEAFPRGGMFANPNLDEGVLGAWRTMGTISDVSIAPCVNPPAGQKIPYVARVTTTSTQATGIRQLVPVIPGKTYTASCMVRLGADGVGDTVATATIYGRFGRSTDHVGTVSGWDETSNAITTSVGDKTGAWTRLTMTRTIPAGQRFTEPFFGVTGEAGVVAEFGHFWFGESRQGDFG